MLARVARNFVNATLATVASPGGMRVFTHLNNAEKYRLYSLVKHLESSPIIAVEVGSYLGASSLFIAAGLRSKGAGNKLYCVDTWQNDAMSEGKKDTFALFTANTRRYAKTIKPLRGLSVDVAGDFHEQIDFLFLDGDHGYEGVKADADAWLPKLKPGATIAFHDYGWAEGVQRVVREDVLPRAVETARLPNLFWARLR